MKRRTFIRGAGAAGVAGLAGCAGTSKRGASNDSSTGTSSGTSTSNSGSATNGTKGTTAGSTKGTQTLVVGTYNAFVDAPSSSPGAWLKKQFESEHDATIQWETHDNDVNYYIERALRGVDIGTDLYVGLDTDMLIKVDQKLSGGQQLFAPLKKGAVEGRGKVKGSLEFDPKKRVIPYDTGYITPVYNAHEVTAPKTFDGLLKSKYKGDLIVENPTSSATGQAFLLHTIKAKGENGYLDYWKKLKKNGVKVLGTWDDAYTAYSNGEAPMVISYSTDLVYAHNDNEDLKKHQVRFLNHQGYANPEGMARFAASDKTDLANQFLSFMLKPEVQAKIAVLNVQFPATTDATLPKSFAKYAKEPKQPVSFNYKELKGNLDTWTNQWAQMFATK